MLTPAASTAMVNYYSVITGTSTIWLTSIWVGFMDVHTAMFQLTSCVPLGPRLNKNMFSSQEHVFKSKDLLLRF
jgi:site-specific recombinase